MMKNQDKSNWHSLPVKKVLKRLHTRPSGLSSKEAKKGLIKFGPNELPKKKLFSFLKVFFDQFVNPLVYVLLFGGLIAFLLGEFIDGSVILAAIFVYVTVGIIQEYKASQALAKLKEYIKPQAKVLRDGEKRIVLAKEIIPGDIIFLEAGDKIPADARLLETNELKVIEAALTGESVPSEKEVGILREETPLADRENMVYMGTVVDNGNAKAVVVATGKNTQIGKIAVLVSEIKEEKTPLQRSLGQLGKVISVLFVVLSLLILVFGVFSGKPFVDMLLTSVAVAVAAIPEGLPAVVVIVLAIGMQKILAKKGLVRRLIAAETLGSTSVICADKTGTLTLGVMEVGGFRTYEKEFLLKDDFSLDAKKLVKIAVFCNDAVLEKTKRKLIVIGESTEKALVMAGAKKGFYKNSLEKLHPRIGEVPFSSERKYMGVLIQNSNLKAQNHNLELKTKKSQNRIKNTIYVKGAPEVVLQRSKFYLKNGKVLKLNSKIKKELEQQYIDLTKRGLRVLGLAFKNTKKQSIADQDIKELVFAGFVFLKDPLRKQAKRAVSVAQKAGVKIIVVTGDHKLTAQAVAKEVGIVASSSEIIEGKEIDKLGRKELFDKIPNIKIFARVTPRHKLQIIKALAQHGEVVAMTGDGVNDAPALKAADIGVALGSGTDVAKEVSDLVILDDNLHTLITAIAQGRTIFENIRKVVLYLLSDSFVEVLLIGGSLLLGLPLPLLPAQILWVNIITDVFPGVALSFEPEEKVYMEEPPRKKDEPILNLEMKVLIFIIGFIDDLALFIIYIWLYFANHNLEYTRTIIFLALGIDSIFYVYACRSFHYTIFHKNPFSNKMLIFASLFGFLTLLVSLYIPFFQRILSTVPLSVSVWLALLGIGLFNIMLIEITKWIFIVRGKKEKRILA